MEPHRCVAGQSNFYGGDRFRLAAGELFDSRGGAGTFPTHTNSANYWVDVVFKGAAAVAPSITAQPVSQSVIAGQTATFSVTATGTAPLSYQWRRNGAAVSGATSASYTTSATTSADNGAQFTVAVGNSAGSVISSAATLTVNAATY